MVKRGNREKIRLPNVEIRRKLEFEIRHSDCSESSCLRSDGLPKTVDPFFLQSFQQTCDDSFDNARPLIDQSGINLHQGGARRDFFPCVSSIENSSDPDD